MSENILILGYGEIGKGIAGVYEGDDFKVYFKDLNNSSLNIPSEIDVLHVCIPYSKNFEEVVIFSINEYNPKLTIINSTIPMGTTRRIYNSTKVNLVHSPVMGKHPNLTESIKTFVKIIGACTEEAGALVLEHFLKIKVSAIKYPTPEDSEVAKLFCTTNYAWSIIFMKFVHKFCEENNLSFEDVYNRTNLIYNAGYEKLNCLQYIRPNLKYMPGCIGGHCLINNCNLIKGIFFPAHLIIELNNNAAF